MRSSARTLVLLALGGLVLVLLLIAAGASLLERPTVLTIAAGPKSSPEFRFATNLAALLAQNRAKVHLLVKSGDGPSEALSQFNHREADLTILRSDQHIPSTARAIAILEHELVLILGRKPGKQHTIDSFAGKRLAIWGEDARNESVLRQIIDQFGAGRPAEIRVLPASSSLEEALDNPQFDWVLTILPYSRLTHGHITQDLAQRLHGLTVLGISESATLARKIPALSDETIDTGLLSLDPPVPAEDTDTVGLQKILVIRSKIADDLVVELMHVLFENKAELAGDGQFATRIEPPDTDKDSLVPAHGGAVQFIDNDVKTFFDRYSDEIYIAMSIGSVFASLAYGLYTSVNRKRRCNAGNQAAVLMSLTDALHKAETPEELEAIETRMEEILKALVQELHGGEVSSKGLSAFRLSYEHLRHALQARRKSLNGSREA